MKLKFYFNGAVVAFTTALIVGCAQPTPKPQTGSGANIDVGEGGNPADSGNMTGTPEKTRMEVKNGVEYGKFENIHFDYDSAAIKSSDRPTLEGIAKWMKENADQKIRVEGHCDERGTPEYNRALGQRRALAAREYLIELGVAADRLGTISFGKEQPEDTGHSPEAWEKNRRDVFGIVK